MKIYFDFSAYIDDVGICFVDDFDHIAIKPNTTFGDFDQNRFGELLKFCGKNPEFCIVSTFYGAEVNRPVRGALTYFLARGDNSEKRILLQGPFNMGLYKFKFDV
jgi:hypothetical protein